MTVNAPNEKAVSDLIRITDRALARGAYAECLCRKPNRARAHHSRGGTRQERCSRPAQGDMRAVRGHPDAEGAVMIVPTRITDIVIAVVRNSRIRAARVAEHRVPHSAASQPSLAGTTECRL
jgi:hypothetical protein